MSAGESTSPEELFPWLLAACDDSPAADVTTLLSDAGDIPPELRQRLEEEAHWCRTVRRLLRSPGTRSSRGSGRETPSDFLSPAVKPGASFGRFQVRGELGRGSYGVVFLAYDPSLGREVALKVPRPEVLVSPGLRARFRQEARAAAGLDHPNLVPVYEVGEEGPVCYIASAYCPGITLAAWLKQRTEPVSYRQAAHLVATLADAVAHAHERGIVHRDLKPANILLTTEAQRHREDKEEETKNSSSLGLCASVVSFSPKITDFGLARCLGEGQGNSQTGAILGTPSYMAPEQAEAKKAIGPAADVYALGAILYELLTGRPPFVADSSLDLLLLVRNQEPLAPSRLRPKLPRDLETICLKCLQKEPARRYASARDLGADLRRYLDEEPIQARPVGTVEWLLKWTRRRPAVAALLAGLVLAVTGGMLASSILWLRAEGQRSRAESETRQSQDRLVSLRVATGVRLMEDGDLYGALLWFVKALEEEQGGSLREALHRTRIGCVLRQCPRLSQLLSHPAAVVDAAFSPDGSRMVTVCDGYGIRVWDATSGRALSPAFGDAGEYSHAAFSPDGNWVVATGRDHTARVWDAASGQPVSSPMRHADTVRWAAFSPDGKRVVTASDDRTARVWDTASGQPLSPPLGHADTVWQAAFSPDGRRVVTASQDRTARVWDALSGQSVWPPLVHNWQVFSAAFSADGRGIITCSHDLTRVWDAATGRMLGTPLRHAVAVKHVVFSPNGRQILTASMDQTARVWDAATGQPASPPLKHAGPLTEAAFSPDGRWVVTASEDGTAHVWDAVTGQLLSPPFRHQSGAVRSPAFSPDGGRVLTAGSDGTARIWDMSPDQRSVPDLIALAVLLAGRRVDEQGNETDVEPETLTRLFEEVQARDPDSLLASADQVRAWHREAAAAAERAADWADALVHLDQSASKKGRDDDLGWRRARARAGLGQWQKARDEFKRDYRDLPGVDEQPFTWHALACAMVDDREQEKRICALLLREFAEPATSANNVAWCCCRFPNRIDDPGKGVALAEKAVKVWPADPSFRNTLGVALYRAGRYAEAIKELDQGVALGHGGGVFDWVFLAMAHQRLGHRQEAQQWLAKIRDRLDPKSTDPLSGTSPLRWDESAELRLIRKEAEDLVRNPGRR